MSTAPPPAERLAWGAGDLGGPLRKIAAGNPAAIHILDNLARILGVEVVDNTPGSCSSGSAARAGHAFFCLRVSPCFCVGVPHISF